MTDQKEESSWKKLRTLSMSHDSASRGVRRVNKLSKNAMRHARRFVSSRLDRLSSIKRMVIGWVVLVVILAGISLVQWIGFRASYTTETPAHGGTFSEGVLGPLETLNPLFARSSAEKSAAKLMFASLYAYDKTGNLKGDIAQSVAVNEAETEYTVTLRPDVTWSDGVTLTAQDVVFTVGLLKDPTTRTEISGWQLIKAEAKDQTTVIFTLPGAYAPFLHSLTFSVLPEHILGDVPPSELREQPFSQAPVTSGPFAFRLVQESSAGSGRRILHMVANPRYVHGVPRLERFQLNVYDDRESIERALNTDEIVATPELIYGNVEPSLQGDFSYQSHSINDGVFALFNTREGVMSSTRVRQALAIGVDRTALREGLAQTTAGLDGPIISSQVTGDFPGFPGYDLEKAKGLLDEEGWTISDGVRQKNGVPLTVRMVTLKDTGFSQATNDLAEVWREDLKVVVDVRVVDSLDPAENVIQSVLQPRNFDVLVYELVLGGDPDVYAYWHSSQARSNGLNFANYSNVIADDALSGGRTRLDEKYRADRYRSFVRRWLLDMPAVPLYQPKLDYITSRSVTALSADAQLVSIENRYVDVIYWAVSNHSVYQTP